jgi:hypothetical protein
VPGSTTAPHPQHTPVPHTQQEWLQQQATLHEGPGGHHGQHQQPGDEQQLPPHFKQPLDSAPGVGPGGQGGTGGGAPTASNTSAIMNIAPGSPMPHQLLTTSKGPVPLGATISTGAAPPSITAGGEHAGRDYLSHPEAGGAVGGSTGAAISPSALAPVTPEARLAGAGPGIPPVVASPPAGAGPGGQHPHTGAGPFAAGNISDPTGGQQGALSPTLAQGRVSPNVPPHHHSPRGVPPGQQQQQQHSPQLHQAQSPRPLSLQPIHLFSQHQAPSRVPLHPPDANSPAAATAAGAMDAAWAAAVPGQYAGGGQYGAPGQHLQHHHHHHAPYLQGMV